MAPARPVTTHPKPEPVVNVRIFAWNPYRFHCYGEPLLDDQGRPSGETCIYIADIFPGWMIPGLMMHEWVELATGSHRLGVAAEVVLYNLLWPVYHHRYLRLVEEYPLSLRIFERETVAQ
jgi:hypothetical protein